MKRLRHEALNTLLIVLGICSAGMGLKGFLLSSNFIDGGVTGVSMLLAKVTAAPLSVWLPVVNVPFIVLGYRQMGRAFAVRSALGIGGLAAVLATVHFPDVTRDLLRRTDVETEGHGGNGVYTEKRSHREKNMVFSVFSVAPFLL